MQTKGATLAPPRQSRRKIEKVEYGDQLEGENETDFSVDVAATGWRVGLVE